VDERPGWSVTWLFRLQHRGRHKQPTEANGDNQGGFARLFPWAVLLLLLVEVGILVWLGFLPR